MKKKLLTLAHVAVLFSLKVASAQPVPQPKSTVVHNTSNTKQMKDTPDQLLSKQNPAPPVDNSPKSC